MIGITLGVLGAAVVTGVALERVARGRDDRALLPGQLLNVGGSNIHVTISGDGNPPVVIISGAGESSYSWLAVQRDIAKFARVITYDRAGLGSSKMKDRDHDVDPVAELRAVIDASGVPGPYLLLGHSLGGLIARRFMAMHPNDVAGMVFVDSTHEFLSDDVKFRQGMRAVRLMLGVMRLLSVAGVPRLFASLGLMPMFPERAHYQRQLTAHEYTAWLANTHRNLRSSASRDEFSIAFRLLEEAREHMQTSESARQYGDLPIAVLTNPGYGDNWLAMHRELAGRSRNSVHYVNDKKGHNVQMLNCGLVVTAVRQVVDSARSGVPITARPVDRQ